MPTIILVFLGSLGINSDVISLIDNLRLFMIFTHVVLIVHAKQTSNNHV